MIELRIMGSTPEEEAREARELFDTIPKSIFDDVAVLQEKVSALESGMNSLTNNVEEVENSISDSGWKTLPLADGIVAYNEANTPQYRKIGSLVVIRGTVKGVEDRNTVIGTLPEGFRPNKANPFVQNTSLGTGNYATQTRATVTTTGDIKLEAISDNAVFGASKWFPIATMFLVN